MLRTVVVNVIRKLARFLPIDDSTRLIFTRGLMKTRDSLAFSVLLRLKALVTIL